MGKWEEVMKSAQDDGGSRQPGLVLRTLHTHMSQNLFSALAELPK